MVFVFTVLYIQNFGVISAVVMMLILVVYYVIIAFLINMNVIADHASVPTKNGSLSIIVRNVCSQNPPCFVSCIISSGDVKLYRSAILDYAENSYFPYANTTNGLRITIFKHNNNVDLGTIIITKKLEDGNHCFAVSGKYSTPKISNCLNATVNGSFLCPKERATRKLILENRSPAFIVLVKFFNSTHTSQFTIFPKDDAEVEFPIEPGALEVLYDEVKRPSFTIFKKEEKNTPLKILQRNTTLGTFDVCIAIAGTYNDSIIEYKACGLKQLTPV